MCNHSQRSKCAKESSIFQGDKTERDDDQKDGFFVDVPAK